MSTLDCKYLSTPDTNEKVWAPRVDVPVTVKSAYYTILPVPQVVVAIPPAEPLEPGDHVDWRSVPVTDLVPLDDSTSEWATDVRYEQAVVDAVTRVTGQPPERLHGEQADLIVRTDSARYVVLVERPGVVLKRTVRRDQLRQIKEEHPGCERVVVSTGARKPVDPKVPFVVWRDDGDDDALRAVLR